MEIFDDAEIDGSRFRRQENPSTEITRPGCAYKTVNIFHFDMFLWRMLCRRRETGICVENCLPCYTKIQKSYTPRR